MRIRTGARAGLASVVLLVTGALLLSGCGTAPSPPPRPVAQVAFTGIPGSGLTLTEAGGGLYATWNEAPPGAGVPQEVLARLDPRTGDVSARNTFSPGVLGAPLFADGALWVTDSGTFGEFLLRLDPAALMVTGEMKAGGRAAGMAAVAAAGGSLWLAGGDELLRVSPVTVAQTAAIALPGTVSSAVAASPDGSLLVVSTSGPSGSSLQRRDPRTGALLAAHPAAGAAVIDGVASAGVWVSTAARAQRYATATMTPEASVTAGGDDIWVAGGRLWVSGGRARDYCADASSGRRLATLPGPGPRQARLLAVAGRVLYYAEPAARGSGTGIAAVPAPAGCG